MLALADRLSGGGPAALAIVSHARKAGIGPLPLLREAQAAGLVLDQAEFRALLDEPSLHGEQVLPFPFLVEIIPLHCMFAQLSGLMAAFSNSVAMSFWDLQEAQQVWTNEIQSAQPSLLRSLMHCALQARVARPCFISSIRVQAGLQTAHTIYVLVPSCAGCYLCAAAESGGCTFCPPACLSWHLQLLRGS